MNEPTIDRMNETHAWREQTDRIALDNPLVYRQQCKCKYKQLFDDKLM